MSVRRPEALAPGDTRHADLVRRREAVAAAGAAVATAAVARPARAAAPDRDPELLLALIAREEAAAFAYRRAPLGPGRDEADHALALRTLLDALGRQAPPAPRTSAALDGPARRLADEGTPEAAVALEDALVAAYEAALLDLRDPGILQTAATALASHAQHRAALRRRAGRNPLAE